MEALSRVSPIILLQLDASLSSSRTCALQTPQKHHAVLYGMLGKPQGSNQVAPSMNPRPPCRTILILHFITKVDLLGNERRSINLFHVLFNLKTLCVVRDIKKTIRWQGDGGMGDACSCLVYFFFLSSLTLALFKPDYRFSNYAVTRYYFDLLVTLFCFLIL